MFIPAVMKPSWFTLQTYEKRKNIFYGSVWTILLLLSVLLFNSIIINQIVGKRYSFSTCYQAIVPVIHLIFRARPSQELPLTVLHTWRLQRRRRSKPCSDNPESAKTCDIIGQNTVLLYTTTTKLDFFLRQNLIPQELFDLKPN